MTGEVEFDDNQQLVRWCNLSGTYRCPDEMAFQADLPLDKFWALKSPQAEGREGNESVLTSSGVALEKILSLSDTEFNTIRDEWSMLIQTWVHTNPKARQCHEKLQEAVAQRQLAIEKYGYLSVAKVPGSIEGMWALARCNSTQEHAPHPAHLAHPAHPTTPSTTQQT